MIALGKGQPDEAAQVAALLDVAFGMKRRRKTAYRLREGVKHLDDLWFVARDGDRVVASIQYWPILIEDLDDGGLQPALLLGPIAVAPALRGQGLGAALIEASLERAKDQGFVQVLLVGDEPYYRRMGFSAASTGGLAMPGPFDPKRLLARQINAGPALPARGAIRSVRSPARRSSAALAEPGQGGKPQKQHKPRPGRQERRLAHA